jgi:hypothetical protein
MDLGANPFQTFQKIVLKLSMPGVINGIVMVFLMAISSFVIPKLLGGGQFVLIGNLIESQFVSVGDWNFPDSGSSDSCGDASHEEDGCTGQLGGGHAKEKQFIFKILYCDLFCFFLSADSGDDGIFI